jgi:hypothetical protein
LRHPVSRGLEHFVLQKLEGPNIFCNLLNLKAYKITLGDENFRSWIFDEVYSTWNYFQDLMEDFRLIKWNTNFTWIQAWLFINTLLNEWKLLRVLSAIVIVYWKNFLETFAFLRVEFSRIWFENVLKFWKSFRKTPTPDILLFTSGGIRTTSLMRPSYR